MPRDPTKTVLYGLVAEQRATFSQVTRDEGGAPSFVNESFERFLRCGVFAHGFARFKCGSCSHEHLMPLSCKTRETAFCISTDTTGVCVQPIYSHEKGSQPCKKGNFLVMIADKDHIVFEYLEKENGPTIYERFRGFSGYVQADAKAVFNLLFADAAELKKYLRPHVVSASRDRGALTVFASRRRRLEFNNGLQPTRPALQLGQVCGTRPSVCLQVAFSHRAAAIL